MVPASRPKWSFWILSGLLVALLAPTAQAVACAPEQCIPIVPFPDVPYVVGAVEFERFVATVTVRDAVATTALELTVHNAGAQATPVQVNLPLPDGAAILAFNLTIGDQVSHGRVLEREAAQTQYNQAVESGQDAALLRQADKRLVALDLNVGPGESRVLRAAYAESVPLAGGSRVYRLPLSQLEPAPAAFDVRADVASRLGAMDLKATGLSMSFAGGKAQATSLPSDPQDLLLTWREEAGKRTSLVAAAPLADGPTYVLGTLCLDGAPLGRDVAFIIDQSGSMAGLKIEEARQALVAAIGTVTPADRFTVVPFSNEAVPFAAALQEGSTSKVQAAQERAGKLGIEGGTNLDAALQEALRQLASGASTAGARLPMVVLLTDGLPTVGVTDHEQIIQRAATANTREAPFIVVPIGLDADYTFLADLALRSGGAYVDPGAPDARLSDRLARLAEVLAGPVASGIALDIEGAEPGSILPKVLPPVYAEDCLEVRFRTNGAGTVRVGVVGLGASGPITATFNFTAADVPVQAAVRSLWGQALVAELLSQEHALAGAAAEEAHAQVIASAIEFGVLSPYTSWVLVVDETAPAPEQASGGGASSPLASGTSTGTTSASATNGLRVSVPGNGGSQYDAAQGSQAGSASKTPGPGLLLVAAALALTAFAARRRP